VVFVHAPFGFVGAQKLEILLHHRVDQGGEGVEALSVLQAALPGGQQTRQLVGLFPAQELGCCTTQPLN